MKKQATTAMSVKYVAVAALMHGIVTSAIKLANKSGIRQKRELKLLMLILKLLLS